ncbi:MAG TPA: hypothetical protein VGX48_15390 [Pyrinomonadaceae bacterium]|jgi:hypothetical protein|nr:hypothetical protein [Pyrinomonadaceae bacterium]
MPLPFLGNFLFDGAFRLFIWLIVRDSVCPDCQGMMHKVRSRTVRDLFRCQVCERLWVKRGGVFESHVSLKDPAAPYGNYLR